MFGCVLYTCAMRGRSHFRTGGGVRKEVRISSEMLLFFLQTTELANVDLDKYYKALDM